MKITPIRLRRTARRAAAEAIALAASCFPDLGPSKLDVEDLSPRDARLAVAIHRTALQRWITIEHVLDLNLRQPMRCLEPRLRGVLISAAAQILFLSRLPTYAIVNESVRIARAMVRPGAAAMVNAVLRRLSQQIQPVACDGPWTAGVDRLPLGNGSLRLRGGWLPDPARYVDHMCIATSHPRLLIQRWVQAYGKPQTTAICCHGVQTPPIIVAMEGSAQTTLPGPDAPRAVPHTIPGYVLWQDGHDQLVSLMSGHPARRVQDPASARPVQATGQLSPAWCVDYCAGRGTKTRQIAWTHPHMQIIATDAAPDRLAQLRRAFEGDRRVVVVEPHQVGQVCPSAGADLLVLDVPCSNTAVLARRPEARYRFGIDTLNDLVSLQRHIVEQAIRWLRSGGHLLYSTCSLEAQENQDQTKWMIQRYGAVLVSQSQTLPAGVGQAYHDGSYHALLKVD